jgi:hypothetical protein|eukprot:COSAG06_NODE_3042_length_5924_cov_7.213562_5_plen_63_part_00
MGPAFAASGFSEQQPPDLLDIRHMRRGYFAATSFTGTYLIIEEVQLCLEIGEYYHLYIVRTR